MHKDPGIGVIIVTYRSATFIADCLESLLACGYPGLKIVIVDNASPDDTPDTIRKWAKSANPDLRTDWPFGPGHRAPRPIDFNELGPDSSQPGELAGVTLFHAGGNLGYAGAINRAILLLGHDPGIDLFWILNPDAVVEPQTPSAIADAARAPGLFGLIGGRIVLFDDPDRIQLDGGRIGRWTARVCGVNCWLPAATASSPEPASLDFISGASMVASREFLAAAGEMDESYFLYFEEIDWQLRRGALPFRVSPSAIVRHRAGATIGSGGAEKPGAFSVWFTNRNLLRFVARWYPWRLPLAYVFAWIRMARNLDGSLAQILAFLAGLHQLPPPAKVRKVLPDRDWSYILGQIPK